MVSICVACVLLLRASCAILVLRSYQNHPKQKQSNPRPMPKSSRSKPKVIPKESQSHPQMTPSPPQITQSHPQITPTSSQIISKSLQIHANVIPNSPLKSYQNNSQVIQNNDRESSLWLPLGFPRALFGRPLGSLWSSWDASGASSGFDAILGVTFRANVAQVLRLRTKTSLPELSPGFPGFPGSSQSVTWGAAPDPPSLAPGARMT